MPMGIPESEEQAEVDITPLIDMTFLLIVFLVTVSQLAVIEVAAKLTLPVARQANPEKEKDKDRLVINLEKETGRIKVAGSVRTTEELESLMKNEADRSRDALGYAKRAVFIRADENLEFGKVQDVMALCKKPEIRIWRLSLKAVKKKPPE